MMSLATNQDGAAHKLSGSSTARGPRRIGFIVMDRGKAVVTGLWDAVGGLSAPEQARSR